MTEDIESKLKSWLADSGDEPVDLFLVGGAVRDRLMGRDPGDLDLVCRNAEEVAGRLAHSRNGVVVPFEKKPGEPCFRVVDRDDPGNHLDIASMRGEDIFSDLSRRDFTINAIAVPTRSEGISLPVVDPYHGAKDIEKGLIRMTGPEAFASDPLRILRAFRFAAELGFQIEDETLAAIRRDALMLNESAAERVLNELLRIFNTPRAALLIRLMDDTGVLEVLFPEISAMKGCIQNSFHHRDVWGHSLMVLENCEHVLNNLPEYFGKTSLQVTENLLRNNRLAVLKLSALLHDVGKPATRDINKETGRITFYSHDVRGAETADEIGRRLKMSNQDRELFSALIREHLHVLNLSNPELKKPARLRWFRKLGDDAVPVIILGMADIKGTLGPDSSEEQRSRHLAWSGEAVTEYYNNIKPELERKDLLTGKDLIEMGVKPGPEMGKILMALRDAQDGGKVRDRDDAVSWAKDLLVKVTEF